MIDLVQHMPQARMQALQKVRSRPWLRDDMIAQAYLGLVEATRTFDETKGFKFSTYVNYCIRSHTRKYLEEMSSELRLGSNPETWRAYHWAYMQQRLDAQELADKFGFTLERAQTIITAAGMRALPLDDKQSDDVTWHDRIAGDYVPPDQLADQRMGDERVERLLAKLMPREREAIQRCVLDEQTITEVAKDWGCSRQWVDFQAKRGLKKLRAMLEQDEE